MDSLLAIASAIITAVYFVYASQVMKWQTALSSTLTLAISHLCAAIALLPLLLSRPHEFALVQQQTIWLPLVLAASLLVVSRELYFYAYARTDVANITVFSALTPLFALVTGYFFLHETPSFTALSGLLLICASIYGLFLKRGASGYDLLQPFRSIAASKPVFCAFLSTIPSAFAAVLQKRLLLHLDPVGFSFFLLLLIGCAALAIALLLFSPRAIMRQLRLLPLHFPIVSAVMLAATHVLFCLVMQRHQAAISLVLQRSSIFFQIVLAYAWLKEKKDIGKRLGVASAIVLGFLLIILPA